MKRADNWTTIFGKAPNVSPKVSLKSDYWRFRLFWGVTALVFGALLFRAFQLQVIEHDDLQSKIDAKIIRSEVIPAARGMLTDRNGVPLAISTPVSTLWLDVSEYLKAAKTKMEILEQLKLEPNNKKLKRELPKANFNLEELALAVGLNVEDLKNKIVKRPTARRLVLRKQIPPDVAQLILSRKFQSVYEDSDFQRFYPQAQPNAQLLGIFGYKQSADGSKDHPVGLEGLEAAWEKDLAGLDGKKRVMRDKRGNMIKDVGQVKADVQGQNMAVSIDSRLQYIMYRELAATGVETNARSVSAMAVDVQTGEVLAMTSWPSYNPNDPNRARNFDAMRNRPVVDMFEPGSTMKPFTVAAALETTKYLPSSMINTSPGKMQIGKFTISDHENLGVIPIGDVIVKSSNVGAARICLSLPDKATIPHFFMRMGLGKKTQLNFPGESRGRVQSKGPWNDANLATMAYGYGLNVTLAQLMQAYSTLAAGGVYRPLTFHKLDVAPEGERILSKTIATEVVHMMEGVVSERGTAIKAAVPGYTVAGKTGTAHKLRADGKGYSKDEYRGLFVGIAPASNPRIALAVVVENPKGAYYGGLVAAPAFSKIMQESLRMMSVPLDKPFNDTKNTINVGH